jgi:predicted nuclease with TOPRIM domain
LNKNDRFDEIHTTFAQLSQRLNVTSEKMKEMEAEKAALTSKCDLLASEISGLARKNERLAEQLREREEEQKKVGLVWI